MDILEEAIEVVAAHWQDDDDIPRWEITVAVKANAGADHEILAIKEEAAARIFPAGTRRFRVETEHPLGIGDSMCFHVSLVYCYGERVVVLNQKALRMCSDETIIMMLTTDWRPDA